MSNIIKKKWNEKIKELNENKLLFDSKRLLNLLLQFIDDVNNISDKIPKELYNKYFRYFEDIDFDSVLFSEDLWYSLDEILKYDILFNKFSSDKSLISNIRDVLWEILIFKSDQNCKNCEDDNLRVLVDSKNNELYFSCDICGRIYNLNLEETDIDFILRPAPKKLIISKGLKKSPI